MRAVITYGGEKTRTEFVDVGYPSSDESGNPRLEVTAKVLLQLGRQGWELESVSPDDRFPGGAGFMYHLKRQAHIP
jgi:hypothetical protein